jgi:hypothetical protein
MARASEYEALSGADAAGGTLADLGDDAADGFGEDYGVEPYGEPGPDEVSWFTGASGAGFRSEREVNDLLGRLLGR